MMRGDTAGHEVEGAVFVGQRLGRMLPGLDGQAAFGRDGLDAGEHGAGDVGGGDGMALVREEQGGVSAAGGDVEDAGLFGERHVHKKILEIPWPTYASHNPWHRKLVMLARAGAAQSSVVVGSQPDLELSTHALGALRTQIRRELAPLFCEIDALVEAISAGQDLRSIESNWQRLLTAPPGAANQQDPGELADLLSSEREAWSRREWPKSGDPQ